MADWKKDWKQSMGVLERHSADSDGPGVFLNLSDGDSAKVVFLPGEPFARERRWDNLDNRSKFTEEVGDANELLGNGKPRYERLKCTISFNVFDVTTKTVRIFEANASTARLIYSAFDMMDGPAKAVFNISRSGSGMDTAYKLEKVSNLPDDKQEQMRKLWLSDAHDLREIQGYHPAGEARGPEGPVSAPAPAPVSAAADDDDFDLF